MGGGTISVPYLSEEILLIRIKKEYSEITYPFKSQNGSIVQSIALRSGGKWVQFSYDSEIGGYKWASNYIITMGDITDDGLLEINCFSSDGNAIIYIDNIRVPIQYYPDLPASSGFKVTENNGNIMIDKMYISTESGSILHWLWYQPSSLPNALATISLEFQMSAIPN